MPTDYPGDQTQTQPPSDPPGPEAQITVALLADGDDVDASTNEQKDKTFADFFDWIYKPHATGDLATRFLRRYRTVQDHTRWALDRNGLPAATFLHWQEWWPGDANLTSVATAALEAGAIRGWEAVITHATQAIVTEIDTFNKRVALDGGDNANDAAMIRIDGLPILGNNTDLAVEAVVQLQDATSADVRHVFGIIHDGSGDPTAGDGLRFQKVPGTANWLAESKNGGSTTSVNTGTAPNGNQQRLRIEFRGANVNDGLAAGAYFFIDGVHKATITTNLPGVSTVSRRLIFAARNATGSSGAAQKLRVHWVNTACAWSPAVTT